MRFIRNSRDKVKIVNGIQVDEIQDARKLWIKSAQSELKKNTRFNDNTQSLGIKESEGIMLWKIESS